MKKNRWVKLSALALAVLLLCACAAGNNAAPSSAVPEDGVSSAAVSPPVESAPSALAPAASGIRRQPEPTLESPAQVTVPAPSLAGNLIGERTEKEIGVCLPAGYAEGDEEYPVLFFLTGYTEPGRYRTELMATVQQRLAQSGAGVDFIIVVVEGANRFGGGWYANSLVSGNWQDYVTKDVVGFVDSHYRTIASPAARGLSGHSMGGLGAIHIAMQQPGLFNYVYAMSPAVFDENGLDGFGPGFDGLELFGERYQDAGEETAKRFRDDINSLDSPFFWPLAYATAFAPDTAAAPPYVAMPAREGEGWAHDEAWQLYNNGAGNWAQKVENHADALAQLQGFVIDFGEDDDFTWIPPGCRYLSAQLEARGISHVLEPYQGTHNSHVDQRIEENLLPYFAERL